MGLVVFLGVGFGITHAVVFLHVFAWLRRLVSGLSDQEFFYAVEAGQGLNGFRKAWLGRLIRCHACAGFWVGTAISIWTGGVVSVHFDGLSYIEGAVADGFILSGFNFCLWVVLRRLGAEEM